jgi:hypothetical protein
MPQIVSEYEYDEIAVAAVESTSRMESREKLRAILPEIATEVAAAMRAAGLDFPIWLSVPNSGTAIATLATPLDPTGVDWENACRIARAIVETHSGRQDLAMHELSCFSAGMPAIAVAELRDEAGGSADLHD